MIVLANMLEAIGVILDLLIGIMLFVVIARAIISWVSPDPYNPIVRFLISSTEPFLAPLRRYMPKIGAGIDITPIILILILYFLKIALVQTIIDYSHELKRPSINISTT